MEEPVDIQEVRLIAGLTTDAVARFSSEMAEELEGAEIHHIGATAMPSGVTKGDVDVNVRIDASGFGRVVEALSVRWRRLKIGRQRSRASRRTAMRFRSESKSR